MAGARMEFKVDDREVLEMLARQAQPPGSDIMNRLGEYLQASTQDRFKTQTAPDGTQWQPPKARYARRKKQPRQGAHPARLPAQRHPSPGHRRSLGRGGRQPGLCRHPPARGHHRHAGAPGTVRHRSVAGRTLFASRKHKRATERQVSIGKHQVVMPARPYLGISQADDQEIREIREIILDWVVTKRR